MKPTEKSWVVLFGGANRENVIFKLVEMSVDLKVIFVPKIQDTKLEKSIYILGSPDLDLMNPNKIPMIIDVKQYYDIKFSHYAIAMFHPVTTEYGSIKEHIKYFVDALIKSKKNYVVIYPNNDLGSNEILEEYKRLEGNNKIKIYPSLKFEYFLSLLNHAEYIVGNSSAGIREAPYYKTPAIDIGTRQKNRFSGKYIFHCDYDSHSILNAIMLAKNCQADDVEYAFGKGNSDQKFLKILDCEDFWCIDTQKVFQDLKW